MVLEPFEVSDVTEVFSVVLDAAVRDKTGRFIQGLKPDHFKVFEGDVSQQLQLVSQESVPAMFVLLVDSTHRHIPKGYIYFAMGFSVFVEMINLRIKVKRPGV